MYFYARPFNFTGPQFFALDKPQVTVNKSAVALQNWNLKQQQLHFIAICVSRETKNIYVLSRHQISKIM